MTNSIRLDCAGNPALQEYFARKETGDKCEITVVFTVKEKTEDVVEGSLSRVELPGEDEPAETTGDEPASIVLRGGKKAMEKESY